MVVNVQVLGDRLQDVGQQLVQWLFPGESGGQPLQGGDLLEGALQRSVQLLRFLSGSRQFAVGAAQLLIGALQIVQELLVAEGKLARGQRVLHAD